MLAPLSSSSGPLPTLPPPPGHDQLRPSLRAGACVASSPTLRHRDRRRPLLSSRTTPTNLVYAPCSVTAATSSPRTAAASAAHSPPHTVAASAACSSRHSWGRHRQLLPSTLCAASSAAASSSPCRGTASSSSPDGGASGRHLFVTIVLNRPIGPSGRPGTAKSASCHASAEASACGLPRPGTNK